MAEILQTDVLIAGGGPCGLMLANELGRRGVSCLLLDPKPGTAFNPQANATQARTMEHFRRLGFAQDIRAQGLPADHPTDIAYFTRYVGHELARLPLPTAAQATEKIRHLGGSWSAAELPHRISQKYVEATLRQQAERLPGIDMRYGWALESFDDVGTHVLAQVRAQGATAPTAVRARYLVGADGARSLVRNTLGIAWDGASGIKREFMGGKMFAVYLRAPGFYGALPHAPAWMYVSVNAQRRAFMASVDGQSEFAFHAAVHAGEDAEAWTADDAQRIFNEAMGTDLPIAVLSVGTWTAGHSLVAQHFQRGRVFIGGDAAHLFTPTGGLGYNTAVEDAVNLGWKLAAVVHGAAPPQLLDSYELERQPLAIRNTAYAQRFADSVGMFNASPLLEHDDAAGQAERERAADYLNRHVRLEFNIPGVTFGGRYDDSPLIVKDGSTPPPDQASSYVPTASPGGRAPHAWLDDGASLYDRFNFEWTLLVLGADTPDTQAFVAGAAELGLDLKLLTQSAPPLRALYEAPLVLIRPDQIVAWRGSNADQARQVLAQASGHPVHQAPAVQAPDSLHLS
ncbi:FAD-dependent oxidoreductase [Polaromonas sp. SM01]|uniref:FAD-dependent oxidoreductase n=1 Tax=Polaromonas sp. SM01 TaxID=3085630 RepID=UPI002981B87D|nr:FAD-dependent oxidoreductase [Polaromonas sp. SM01]MDW5442151.1 FAD-dependent oxidoreductase [Polaromonas sp. SM01]